LEITSSKSVAYCNKGYEEERVEHTLKVMLEWRYDDPSELR